MNWIPLEQCLGEGYIETNYYWSPTKSPSISPSKSPSAAPSKSPSFEPTVQPSDYPTYSPSSSEPTETPSMVSFVVLDAYLHLITSCAHIHRCSTLLSRSQPNHPIIRQPIPHRTRLHCHQPSLKVPLHLSVQPREHQQNTPPSILKLSCPLNLNQHPRSKNLTSLI